ncbi:MAG: hypothetical protein AAF513_20570 [Pseudomonadota bacterium]
MDMHLLMASTRMQRRERMFRSFLWLAGISVFMTAYGFSWLLV